MICQKFSVITELILRGQVLKLTLQTGRGKVQQDVAAYKGAPGEAPHYLSFPIRSEGLIQAERLAQTFFALRRWAGFLDFPCIVQALMTSSLAACDGGTSEAEFVMACLEEGKRGHQQGIRQ